MMEGGGGEFISYFEPLRPLNKVEFATDISNSEESRGTILNLFFQVIILILNYDYTIGIKGQLVGKLKGGGGGE